MSPPEIPRLPMTKPNQPEVHFPIDDPLVLDVLFETGRLLVDCGGDMSVAEPDREAARIAWQEHGDRFLRTRFGRGESQPWALREFGAPIGRS